MMLARAVPAKWSLLGVNKKPELIEKRRRELEVRSSPAWLSGSTKATSVSACCKASLMRTAVTLFAARGLPTVGVLLAGVAVEADRGPRHRSLADAEQLPGAHRRRAHGHQVRALECSASNVANESRCTRYSCCTIDHIRLTRRSIQTGHSCRRRVPPRGVGPLLLPIC